MPPKVVILFEKSNTNFRNGLASCPLSQAQNANGRPEVEFFRKSGKARQEIAARGAFIAFNPKRNIPATSRARRGEVWTPNCVFVIACSSVKHANEFQARKFVEAKAGFITGHAHGKSRDPRILRFIRLAKSHKGNYGDGMRVVSAGSIRVEPSNIHIKVFPSTPPFLERRRRVIVPAVFILHIIRSEPSYFLSAPSN